MVAALVLSGCSTGGFSESEAITKPQAVDRTEESEVDTDVGNAEESAEDAGSEETKVTEGAEESAANGTTDILENLRDQQEGKYAFSCLTDEEQTLYTEILGILMNQEEDGELSSLDIQEIDRVFQCVLLDHPEIFYTDGYTYTQYTMADQVVKITFSGSYLFTTDEVKNMQAQIEMEANKDLAQLPEDATDYEKVKYIYETIIQNTEYDVGAENNQNISSVFLNQKSVCQGYAKAIQFLLEKVKIPSVLVIGTVIGGEGHAWNLVQIDGAYYYVDATWGDAFYLFESPDYAYVADKVPPINYDYLCVTTDQINITHTIDTVVPMPRCVSMDANYYVMEGAYFESADPAKMEALFQKSYEAEEEMVTLKCATADVYEQIKQMLLDEQGIFQYIKSEDGTVAYTDSDEQCSISFWL